MKGLLVVASGTSLFISVKGLTHPSIFFGQPNAIYLPVFESLIVGVVVASGGFMQIAQDFQWRSFDEDYEWHVLGRA